MQPILDYVMAHPLYGAAAAVLLLFLLTSLLKKAFKLALIALVLNLGYGYFLHDLAMDAYERASAAAGKAADEAREAIQRNMPAD